MSIKIDQALIKKFEDSSFGLPIAYEDSNFDPAGSAYAEIIVAPNNITPLGLSETNETDGVFRVILRYPTGNQAVAAKQKADSIFAAFPIGQRLTYDSTVVLITSNKREPGYPEDGWYKLVLTMAYKAYLTR